jgi:hypothetical protein
MCQANAPEPLIAGHRPWYISAKNRSSTICLDCQDVFEPLFVEYGVDLVLSGHVHFYERNSPIAFYNQDPNGLNNPKAPWYITNGAAGHYDGLDPIVLPAQPYSQSLQNTTYGWSRLTFHNCTHLTHDFVASGNNTVLDSATLFKDRTCGASTGSGAGINATATSSTSSSTSMPASVPTSQGSVMSVAHISGLFIAAVSCYMLLG